MNDIKQKRAQYYITVLLESGVCSPFIGHYLTKFHPFQYYRTASSGLVFG